MAQVIRKQLRFNWKNRSVRLDLRVVFPSLVTAPVAVEVTHEIRALAGLQFEDGHINFRLIGRLELAQIFADLEGWPF